MYNNRRTIFLIYLIIIIKIIIIFACDDIINGGVVVVIMVVSNWSKGSTLSSRLATDSWSPLSPLLAYNRAVYPVVAGTPDILYFEGWVVSAHLHKNYDH